MEKNKTYTIHISAEADPSKEDFRPLNLPIDGKNNNYAAWCEVEKLHPEVKVWETVTPCFETRNIHFYVNRCGFHIVEYYNKYHKDPNDHGESDACMQDNTDGMFRFEKRIK